MLYILLIFLISNRTFSAAAEKREQDKNSDIRYQNFVKLAGRHGNTNGGLGSFGGKPKQFKGNRNVRKSALKPAWLGEPRFEDSNAES